MPAEDDRTPPQTRLPGTVAWRGGCPLTDRRPVAGTDHLAREAGLEASNPGRSGYPPPPLRHHLRQPTKPAISSATRCGWSKGTKVLASGIWTILALGTSLARRSAYSIGKNLSPGAQRR